MKTRIAILFATLCLSGISLPASALWIEMQLKPNGMKASFRTFSVIVTVKDNGMQEFTVTMTADPKHPLRAFIDGSLSLRSGKDDVALVPVAVSKEDDKLIYRFRVTARALEYSRFQIDESMDTVYRNADGTPQTDKKGNPKVERAMGGQSFWLLLRDFTNKTGPYTPE